MPWVAAAIAAAAAISYISSKNSSNAATDAGKAQNAVSEQGLQQAQSARQIAYGLAASAALPSASELNLMSATVGSSLSSLLAQHDAINQAQTDMDNLSPAIKASGEETTALLQGKASSLLKPIQDQRALQRTNLQQQLASRMGPGYETTAAGILALNNFDNQTVQTMTNAQFQAFNQSVNATTSLSNTAAGLGSFISNSANQSTSLASSMQTTQQQLGMQAANIYAGGSAGVLGANNTLGSTIPNLFAGQMAQGQNTASLAGGLGQTAATYGMLSSLYGSPQSGAPAPAGSTAAGGYTFGSQVSPGSGPIAAPQQMNMVMPTPGGGYAQTSGGYTIGSFRN